MTKLSSSLRQRRIVVLLAVLVPSVLGACGQQPASWPHPVGLAMGFGWDGVDRRMKICDTVIVNTLETSHHCWTFSGSDWALAPAAPVWDPSSLHYGGFLLYDPFRKREVYYTGGGQIWEWDGRTWQHIDTEHCVGVVTKLPPSGTPDCAGRSSVQIAAFSPELRAVVVPSPTMGGPQPTWLYDGVDWRTIDTPPPGVSSRFDYDPIRHSVLSLSGYQTWVFDGKTWSAIPIRVADSAFEVVAGRQAPAIAFDQQRGKWVVFGGTDGKGWNLLSDTWIGDGSTWIRVSPKNSPSPRLGSSMTWDPQRHTLLLFGGLAEHNKPLADTWAWDGGNWTQVAGPVYPRQPSPSPSPSLR